RAPALVRALAALVAVPACTRSLPNGDPPPGPSRQEEEYKGPPMFEDVTATSGIDFTYRNGEEAGNFAIIESLGGGVALFDYDKDGLIDIFVTGGGYFDGKNVLGHPGRLYKNLGNWKFKDVTDEVGLGKGTSYS